MEYHMYNKNEKEFEQAFQQVKIFYFDYDSLLVPSDKKLYFIGLYLLYLLSDNRNTDYCFELEFLQLDHFSNNFISLAVDIEHSISEGTYNKLFNMSSTVSDPFYVYFLNKLSSSIRYQIAKSAEKSYDYISINKCLEILMINRQELDSFIDNFKNQANNRHEIDWIIDGENVIFKKVVKDKNYIPSDFIVRKTVKLATELEKII
jgi:hypothetical protein